MISEISVYGFKSLSKRNPLSIKDLNILAGPNASGKSSLLQILLLLRQSADKEGFIEELHLSGPLYEAGTAQDILHPSCERKISVTIKDDDDNYEFQFELNREKGEATSERKLRSTKKTKIPSVLSTKGLDFSYLNAERIGPRVTYSLPPDNIHISGLIGRHGEFTTAALARAAKDIFTIDKWDTNTANSLAIPARELDNKEILDELTQSEGRLDLVCNIMLDWIIPGAKFDAQEHHNTDSTALRFIRDPSASKAPTRSTHIGFGLTYTLPVIAAALSLSKGGVLFIENPEAHLHPFSQSRIGIFLALMAGTGRQVFIETHSDHVINGVRLAVKNKFINNKNVILNSFSRDSDLENSEITQLKISEDGRPEFWPDGFFDQIENDLINL